MAVWEVALAVILTILGLAILAILLTRWTRRKQNGARLLDYEDGTGVSSKKPKRGRGFQHSYSTESEMSYDDQVDTFGKIVIIPGYVDEGLTKKSDFKAQLPKHGEMTESGESLKKKVFIDSDESFIATHKKEPRRKAKVIELENDKIGMEVKEKREAEIVKEQEAQIKSEMGVTKAPEPQRKKSAVAVPTRQESQIQKSEEQIPKAQESQVKSKIEIPKEPEAQEKKSDLIEPTAQESLIQKSEEKVPNAQESQVKSEMKVSKESKAQEEQTEAETPKGKEAQEKKNTTWMLLPVEAVTKPSWTMAAQDSESLDT
ncbi:testis-expressed basic protein 1 [Fukomys damarensis]|uniref:testis-expressed basic protein 1 n=1 Tax=Fukomys damarensis TaxID=885580 RepID=UPI0008FF5EDF|nr:testis-expressed basic protein 1 [Fukomys damarensis]